MIDLTSNHLYRATAPLLTEDPAQAPDPKPQPPHKFWRGEWEHIGHPDDLILINILHEPSTDYFLNAQGQRRLSGPIFPTAEACEQANLENLNLNLAKGLAPIWKLNAPHKVDEHGAPL